MPKGSKYAAKRKQAKDLYCRHSLQQQEIAKLISVSEKTISKWKHADDWDRERAAYTTTKESELRRMYGQLAKINDAIDASEEQYANSKQADIIGKLSSAIRTLESDTGAAATIDVAMAFIDWSTKRRVDIASVIDGKRTFVQVMTEELDIYIKSLFK